MLWCAADLDIEDDPLPDYHEDPHHAFTVRDVFGGIFHSNDANYISRYINFTQTDLVLILF